MESVKQRIAYIEDLNESGVGTKVDEQQFELACLRQLVAVTEQVCELNKALDVSLRVQVDQANRISQMLDEIKRAESAIGSLGWMSLDTAISLELSKLNKQISDLQGQVRLLTEQRDAVVVENVALKKVISDVQGVYYKSDGVAGYHLNGQIATWDELMPDLWEIETPTTDAVITSLRAEWVEMFAESLKVVGSGEHPYAAVAREFARQLRESKGANHE